ncbi:hypothetical protein F4861DRAFT_100446 [Xylaria intraflava]|nr:hypothetical protein F4861DRAFT_100446 [Xylaria intraflava]
MLKESPRILSSCTNFPGLGISTPASYTSPWLGNSNSRRQRAPRSQQAGHPSSLKWDCSSTRFYASVSDPFLSRPAGAAAGYTWPTSRHPTPYEILAHPRGSQYNKALFYHLVKVYHPDSSHATADSSIPRSVRLERYHLVINANEILSNPAKRRAYDLYGAGWKSDRTPQDLYREAGRSWRNQPGNASANATWEDWERWHQERNGDAPPQTPVYMSNELFVILLCSCMVVGSFAQARRARTNTMNLVEMRDQKHAAINNDMRRRQMEQANLNPSERVERFLRHRENWNLVSLVNSDAKSPSEGK